jgi:hypothetical protein
MVLFETDGPLKTAGHMTKWQWPTISFTGVTVLYLLCELQIIKIQFQKSNSYEL